MIITISDYSGEFKFTLCGFANLGKTTQRASRQCLIDVNIELLPKQYILPFVVCSVSKSAVRNQVKCFQKSQTSKKVYATSVNLTQLHAVISTASHVPELRSCMKD